ncbi:MAG: hypothetical protein COT24_05360 [Candidatus Kerfeldbacteria bacterium CG08_land_8_20_14_0_20_40_16]|uniref:Uncharacterized protein n=1 Tax=Candidatus Kerfeldbacteria bacterium CG08_land_8_20_14_0_20_40_16 TaxID=2014244 RepID=A0A2H0YWF0_9BACT|nr:MAG: hypothetical protein COT24_05360 [Candidatus Kerfeldbacteria bacterium CG08_land_8_20_14_0_20_40_16]
MAEKISKAEALKVIQSLIGSNCLEIQKGPKGLFLRVHELHFRCGEKGHLHSRLFLTRDGATANSKDHPNARRITDNTEPTLPNEWSVFPRLVILPSK